MNATIKRLQASASSAAETSCRENKDALGKIEELTEQVCKWKAEHSAAVERADSLEAQGKEHAQKFAAELEQLRAELAAEREGKASDASKAAADAEEMNATIKRLQASASSAAETSCRENKDALGKIEELTEQVCKWKAEHSAAVERADSLEAQGKEHAQKFAAELEQLRAELAAEREGRASDGSKAAADAEEMNATIHIARETLLKELFSASVFFFDFLREFQYLVCLSPTSKPNP